MKTLLALIGVCCIAASLSYGVITWAHGRNHLEPEGVAVTTSMTELEAHVMYDYEGKVGAIRSQVAAMNTQSQAVIMPILATFEAASNDRMLITKEARERLHWPDSIAMEASSVGWIPHTR